MAKHVLGRQLIGGGQGVPVDAVLQFLEEPFGLALIEAKYFREELLGFRVGESVIGRLGSDPLGALLRRHRLARVRARPRRHVQRPGQAVGLFAVLAHESLPAIRQWEGFSLDHLGFGGVHRLGGTLELIDHRAWQHLARQFQLHVAGQQSQPLRAGVGLQVGQHLREVARIGLGQRFLAGLQVIHHATNIIHHSGGDARTIQVRRPAGAGVAEIIALGRIRVAGQLHLIGLERHDIGSGAWRDNHSRIVPLRLQITPESRCVLSVLDAGQIRIGHEVGLVDLGVQLQQPGTITGR